MQRFQAADGRTLSYLTTGDGPMVVMLPGGPGMDPAAYFSDAHLPGHRQVIVCPRGTGASDPPATPEGYRIAGYVSDLEELRRHLDCDTLTLYGNSHGAMIALAYARTYPDRVARMVLVNGPARMDDRYREHAQTARQRFAQYAPGGAQRLEAAAAAEAQLDAGCSEDEQRRAFRALMDRYVARNDAPSSAYLDRLCAAPMNFDAVGPMYAELMQGLDLLDAADHTTTPTLVLAGALDTTVPAEHMREISNALPHATYQEFDGAGHFIEAEAHQPWADAVLNFLAEA